MAAKASSWSNLLSDATDVEALSLQIPIEGIANRPMVEKEAPNDQATTLSRRISSCACRGRVSA
jgi:hypothetical protein